MQPGTTLGAYEILSKLGAGGMGEVYRARDTRVDRDVALKILPDALARDPDRTARFAREARTLAALNHPHIAQLYGFEEVGESRALVMELVEGEDLSQLLSRGPLPLDEALPIARQIAEALQAAHDAGIIHRDLKPANIKVRPDGTVKVLDFGLAKIAEPAEPSPDATQSPTITTPAMTAAGMILGTAAYMSPEQAKGKPADKRSDIWAFGCVLYEMLTGSRAFVGEDVSDTLAAILRSQPDWVKLDHVPNAVRRLVERCLERDRGRRIADVSVVRYVLSDIESFRVPSDVPAAGRAGGPGARAWFAAGILIAIASVFIAFRWSEAGRTRVPAAVQRFNLATLEGAPYAGAARGDIALSADGTRLVYPAIRDNRRMLYIRTIGALDDRALPGTEDAVGPLFSPDGEWLAFFQTSGEIGSEGTLRKVSLRGGPPINICSVPNPVGASWSLDGTITYATANRLGAISETSLFAVSAGGGSTPRRIEVPHTTNGAELISFPEVLPNVGSLLFASRSSMLSPSQVSVFNEETGAVRKLIDSATHPRYVASGHILYMSDRTLMAVPFDAQRLEVTGEPVAVAENVAANFRGDAGFAVSQQGTLVYAVAEAAANTDRTLIFVDRRGREQDIGAPARGYFYPRVSPNGASIALDVRPSGNALGNPAGGAGTRFDADIWTWDIPRRVLTPLTRDSADDQYPAWTPDGKHIAFSSFAGTRSGGIYLQSIEAAEKAQLLVPIPSAGAPYAFTPDGLRIIVRGTAGSTTDDLMLLTLPANPTAQAAMSPLLATRFVENNAALSPDGHWVAYQSNESGAFEIHVRPFPNVDAGRTLVSTSGGTRPVWSRDGKELFYLVGQSPEVVKVMRVPVDAGATFSAGAPEMLFEGQYFASPLAGGRGRSFDVMPDGKRFVMIKDGAAPASAAETAPFVVVLNWTSELPRGSQRPQ